MRRPAGVAPGVAAAQVLPWLLGGALAARGALATRLRQASPKDGGQVNPYAVYHARPTLLPMQAPDTGRRKMLRRRREFERSGDYVKWMKQLGVDDSPDTTLWNNFSAFMPKGDLKLYWDDFCNGTLKALRRHANYTAMLKTHPLLPYKVVNKTVCGGAIGQAFTSEVEAARACGLNCSGVIDVGCTRQQFRLCEAGAKEVPASDGSCLRQRPPTGAETAQVRPPTKVEYWEKFCAANATRFRVLFPGKACASPRALTGPCFSEGDCADLAKADAQCSTLFDFKEEGSGVVCRCVDKGQQCNAADTKGSIVYIIE